VFLFQKWIRILSEVMNWNVKQKKIDLCQPGSWTLTKLEMKVR